MELSNGNVIVGVFEDRVNAEEALNELHAAGFSEDETGFIIRGTKAPGDDSSPIENDAMMEEKNTGEGILTGGALGGVLGAAATGLIPGVGPVIAAGALAGILGGAAAGGVAGGVVGTLMGVGVPEDQAKFYEDEFNAGRPLITVQADGRSDKAWTIMQQHGAYNAHTRPSAQH